MGSIRLMAGGFKKRPYGSKRNRVPYHSLLWIMQDCVSLGIYMWFRRGISVSGVGLGVTCKQNIEKPFNETDIFAFMPNQSGRARTPNYTRRTTAFLRSPIDTHQHPHHVNRGYMVFQDLLWPRRFAQWFNLFS